MSASSGWIERIVAYFVPYFRTALEGSSASEYTYRGRLLDLPPSLHSRLINALQSLILKDFLFIEHMWYSRY